LKTQSSKGGYEPKRTRAILAGVAGSMRLPTVFVAKITRGPSLRSTPLAGLIIKIEPPLEMSQDRSREGTVSPLHEQELDSDASSPAPSSPPSTEPVLEDSSMQQEPQRQPSQEPNEESNTMETESSADAPASPVLPEASSQQPATSNALAPPQQPISRSSSPMPKRNSIVPTEAIKEPTVEMVPRLVIEKMVLINFKSYAGRQEIGPFHKSFTSVVGPNGSGKSNVIDALLFVFGYRANKMRQGKLSELIHNSAGAEDVESCTVEIHFCEILDLVSSVLLPLF